MGIIYCISCIHNNKKYIGKTKTTLPQRMKNHWCGGKKLSLSTNPLYEDIHRYGREGFIYGVIEDNIPPESLSERESYWVSEYWDTGLLYNMRKPSGCNNRKEYNKLHYQQNRDKKLEYYQDNKERISERNSEKYYSDPEYREYRKKKGREYYKNKG